MRACEGMLRKHFAMALLNLLAVELHFLPSPHTHIQAQVWVAKWSYQGGSAQCFVFSVFSFPLQNLLI